MIFADEIIFIVIVPNHEIVLNCFQCSAEGLEDLDEEEMLMRAIALSLEEEEELCSIKGELLEKQPDKTHQEKHELATIFR